MNIRIAAIALVFVAGAAKAGAGRQQETAEQVAAYAWFDSLGFVDGLTKPCVRVDWSFSVGQEGSWTQGDIAFLAAETSEDFTILSAGLGQATLKRGPQSGMRMRFVRVDFASEILKQLEKRSKPSDDGTYITPSGPAELFVYSRAAAARGLDALSKHLFELSVGAERAEKGSYLEVLQAMIADGQIEGISIDMGDLQVPREALLGRLDEFVMRFPTYKEVPLARRWIGGLKALVAAAKARAAVPPKAWNSMNELEKVDELVYELQDQNGRTVTNPGSCDVFADPRREKSPAGQLANIGYAAVPRLIDALSDARLSRSIETSDILHVGFAGNPDRVLCVGEVAAQILERIMSRPFGGYVAAAADWSQRRPEIERRVRSWWADFQSRGEQAILAQDVTKGGWEASKEVNLLAEKYPAAAPAAIEEGLKHTDGALLKTVYVAALAKCAAKTPEAMALARRLMASAADLPVRVSAASVVALADVRAAAEAMGCEWSRLRRDQDSESTNMLAKFLICCGSVEAVEEVRSRLESLSVYERAAIAQLLDGGGNPPEWSGLYRTAPLPMPSTAGPHGAAVERLLATELSDTEQLLNFSMAGPKVALYNPRVCDIGVYDMSKLWPPRYQYHCTASPFETEAQRIVAINVWRSAHGMRLLRLPARPTIRQADVAVVAPLIREALAARTDSARAASIARLRPLGLSALAAVAKAAYGLPENDPGRRDMVRLSSYLACTVREIRLTGSAFSGVVRKELTGMRGTSLTGERLVWLVQTINRWACSKKVDFGITGVREGDGTGFSIEVNLRSRSILAGQATRETELLRVGGSAPYNASGTSSSASSTPSRTQDDPWTSERDQADFLRRFEKAFAADWREVVTFTLGLSRPAD